MVDVGDGSNIGRENGVDIIEKNGEKEQKLQRKEGEREG